MPHIAAYASSPVDVTVAISYDWLTTLIAVAGFLLALGSLGWQFYTWRGSGSRVEVTARFGIFPGQMVPGLPASLVFGIGLALAQRFALNGLDVVLADVEESALGAAAESVERLGVKSLAVRTDVSDEDSVRALAAAAVERFRSVHVVRMTRRRDHSRPVVRARYLLALGYGREPVGRNQWNPGFPPDPRAAGWGPYRQHRQHGWPGSWRLAAL